jgi:hypothetical protein
MFYIISFVHRIMASIFIPTYLLCLVINVSESNVGTMKGGAAVIDCCGAPEKSRQAPCISYLYLDEYLILNNVALVLVCIAFWSDNRISMSMSGCCYLSTPCCSCVSGQGWEVIFVLWCVLLSHAWTGRSRTGGKVTAVSRA